MATEQSVETLHRLLPLGLFKLLKRWLQVWEVFAEQLLSHAGFDFDYNQQGGTAVLKELHYRLLLQVRRINL